MGLPWLPYMHVTARLVFHTPLPVRPVIFMIQPPESRYMNDVGWLGWCGSYTLLESHRLGVLISERRGVSVFHFPRASLVFELSTVIHNHSSINNNTRDLLAHVLVWPSKNTTHLGCVINIRRVESTDNLTCSTWIYLKSKVSSLGYGRKSVQCS